MREFKDGKLKSDKSGKKEKDRDQTVAMAISEARESGAKVPSAPAKKKKSASKK